MVEVKFHEDAVIFGTSNIENAEPSTHGKTLRARLSASSDIEDNSLTRLKIAGIDFTDT